jgi:hypothetical protein
VGGDGIENPRGISAGDHETAQETRHSKPVAAVLPVPPAYTPSPNPGPFDVQSTPQHPTESSRSTVESGSVGPIASSSATYRSSFKAVPTPQSQSQLPPQSIPPNSDPASTLELARTQSTSTIADDTSSHDHSKRSCAATVSSLQSRVDPELLRAVCKLQDFYFYLLRKCLPDGGDSFRFWTSALLARTGPDA